MLQTFITHDKQQISGKKLTDAFNTVADDWKNLAYAIRKEDAYASHVTEQRKEKALQDMLKAAEKIRNCEITSFTIWQRVNTVSTGECVALLGGK